MGFWPLSPDQCPRRDDHRFPEGPNEDLDQCRRCGRPTYRMRPENETFGLHLADCSLARFHKGQCEPGGAGHPRAEVVRGYWPELEGR